MDEESNTIAIPKPAATVMLIDDRPDLQVFMMKRSSKTVFGGMWVFPGGTVDATDSTDIYATHSRHLTDEQASERLEVSDGGLAFYVAAIREAFEEAGILLALESASERPLAISQEDDKERFRSYCLSVHSGETALSEVLTHESLCLDVSAIRYVARWITPPMVPKRFDTRFFVTRMPENQHPKHDDKELVNSAWFAPADLIERANAKEIAVMAPTLRMLQSLLPFSSAAEVLTAAAERREAIRVPFADKEDGAGPSPMDGVEPGWVYLRP